MTRRTHGGAVAGALAAGLLFLAGCTATAKPHPSTHVPAGALTLVAFSSCDDLLDGLRAAAKATVGPYGLVENLNRGIASDASGGAVVAPRAAAGPAAVPDSAAGPAYSGTNTAEVGVDEPDLVKTDGHRIVTVHNGVLTVVDAATRRTTGTLDVGADNGDANLLLAGDRALVLLPSGGLGDIAGPRLLLVDVSGTPKALGTYAMDGSLVDARQVGSTVRVVLSSSPRLSFPQLENATNEQRLAANRAAIDRAGADVWLPRYQVESGGKVSGGQVPCDAVSRPAEYSGTALLTVLSFDLGRSTLGDGLPVTVVADGNLIYSNGPNLYVVNDNRWRTTIAAKTQRTDIYQFDASGTGRPRYVAAGSVPGYAINQYALSDFAGNLRVATTNGDASAVYVLRRNGSSLKQVGEVDGLGQGQRIYSVRFDGTVGYVVTFRQTDPLYVLDLRDPARPTVTGELEINGYSAYLHPIGNGRLLGLGQEADANGRVQGTQVSLFDVSNPAAPKRLAQYHVQYGHSVAEFDPHAFLYWPATGLLVVPMSTPMYAKPGAGPTSGAVPILPEQPGGGAVALHVTGSAIAPLGTVSHQNEQIVRSLVIDRTLWTVSTTGLAAYAVDSLAAQAWLAF